MISQSYSTLLTSSERIVVMALTLLFSVYANCREASAGRLYIIAGRMIQTTVTTPSGIGPIKDVVSDTMGNAMQVDFSPATKRIYWPISSGYGAMRSSRADGSDIQELIALELSNRHYLNGLAIDNANQFVYYTDRRSNDILRSGLDGSNLQIVVPGGQSSLYGPESIRIDEAGGRIYWTDSDLGQIRSANLDGRNVVDIISTSGQPYGIDLDLARGKIYWSELHDFTSGSIRRANLDGTSAEVIVSSGLYWPTGVAVDSQHQRIYWTDTWYSGPVDYSSTLQSSDLNGMNRQTLVNFSELSELGPLLRAFSVTFVIPEPDASLLLCLGAVGLATLRRWPRGR